MSQLNSLGELEARLAEDMAWLNLPAKEWLPRTKADGGEVVDVVVVGGGLCGLVTLAALKRVGINNAKAFDRSPEGREGPWITYARMETLRTRKEAAGPALGIPSLTFRAWFEAQFGAEAFARMDLIPRGQWMDYLVWYRKILGLAVENDTRVTGVDIRRDGLISVSHASPNEAGHTLARRVVVATGLDGLGAPTLPALARQVPSRFVAHGAAMIDMSALRGKRVAVVGAGASAMDNAAAALENCAARVDIFIRRTDIPRVDKFTGIGSQGLVHGYFGLPDDVKWALMLEGERAQIPPPRHSVLRVSRHANAFFHLRSPLLDLFEEDRAVTVVTPRGRYHTDFVIFATGFSVDFDKRPEFAGFSRQISLWSDVYQPARGMEHEGLSRSPYLGANFEFLPKAGGNRAVSRIYCFAYPAVTSHGKITSGVPSISDGANRLAQGIARSLLVEDRDQLIGKFRTYDTPELLGDEWRDADQIVDELNV
jgi:cation diffusion facilitator CzcD-associated flavoprotein CzcO